jgi:hypothetical protein
MQRRRSTNAIVHKTRRVQGICGCLVQALTEVLMDLERASECVQALSINLVYDRLGHWKEGSGMAVVVLYTVETV